MDPNGLFTVLLLAIGLAMDCFAVSVTRGVSVKNNRLKNALALAVSFGLFQAFMPLAGWKLGEELITYISGIDHWIAFGLLGLIGLKMIHESVKNKEKELKPLTLSLLIALSFATSIDAFAVGLSIAFLGMDVLEAALVIGTTSLVLSLAGFYIGCMAGDLCKDRAEQIGGIILILLGLKILIEHLLL